MSEITYLSEELLACKGLCSMDSYLECQNWFVYYNCHRLKVVKFCYDDV